MFIGNLRFDSSPRDTSELISAGVVSVVNAVVLTSRERLRNNLEGLRNDLELGDVAGEDLVHVGVVDHLEVHHFRFQDQRFDFGKWFDQFV